MNLSDIKNQVGHIFARQGVIKAAVFGSFATGEEKRHSDVDILVKFKTIPSLMDISRLKLKLEDKIGRHVDVITYDGMHPRLKSIILNEQKIIYEKNPKILIGHILDSIYEIEKYKLHVTKEKFTKMTMMQDAVIRRIEIIGEAVKR